MIVPSPSRSARSKVTKITLREPIHTSSHFGRGPGHALDVTSVYWELVKAVPLWLRLFDVSGTMGFFISALADRILEIKLVDPKKEWEVHNSFVVKQHGVDATFAVSKYPEQEKVSGGLSYQGRVTMTPRTSNRQGKGMDLSNSTGYHLFRHRRSL